MTTGMGTYTVKVGDIRKHKRWGKDAGDKPTVDSIVVRIVDDPTVGPIILYTNQSKLARTYMLKMKLYCERFGVARVPHPPRKTSTERVRQWRQRQAPANDSAQFRAIASKLDKLPAEVRDAVVAEVRKMVESLQAKSTASNRAAQVMTPGEFDLPAAVANLARRLSLIESGITELNQNVGKLEEKWR